MKFEIDDNQQIDINLWTSLVKFHACYKCEDCEYTLDEMRELGHQYNAHHVDGDDQNNCLNNGRAMCAVCHMAEHTRMGRGGWKLSEETIARQRLAAQHRATDPEIRKKISLANSGKVVSEETRRKLSIAQKKRYALERGEV